MDSVVHFEMPGDDIERMKKFYEEAFDWKMTQLGKEMNDYVMVSTAEVGENGMPKNPGTINGGFFKRSEESSHPSVVVSVKNIDEAIEKIKAAGGEIMTDKMDIPNVGTYVAIKDSEGNQVGVLQ